MAPWLLLQKAIYAAHSMSEDRTGKYELRRQVLLTNTMIYRG